MSSINDDLVSAIKELNAATVSLRTLIAREYPTRKEMEREFVRKDDSKRRVTYVVLTIFVSSIVCFIGTTATVSTCFLGDPKHPLICNVMPGYSETIKRQEQIEKIHQNLEQKIKNSVGN